MGRLLDSSSGEETVTELYVLTYEYSDKSAFFISGVTQDKLVMLAWIHGGENTHAYIVPLDQILPGHPRSNGWSEFKP